MNDPAVLQDAVTLHRVGHLSEAARLYRKVLHTEPENPDALHLLGVLTSQQGDHEGAITLIQQAVELRPRTASFHVNLARAFQAAGNFDGAAVALQDAVKRLPDDPQLHLMLAETHRRTGKLAEARAAYERALELDNALGPAHAALGRLLGEMSEHLAAAKHLERAVELAPHNESAWNDLGVARASTGDRLAAEKAYLNALKSRPDYAEAYSNLGHLLAGTDRAEQAIRYCRRAMELKPDLIEAHWTLGRALRHSGRDLEAIAIFREVLEAHPEQWEIGISLMQCLEHHRPDAFEPDLDAVLLELFQSDEVAHQKLAFVTSSHLRFKHDATIRALQFDTEMVRKLSQDPLLNLWLSRTFNVDVAMEAFLVRLRRQLLMEPELATMFSVELLCALAQQCFNNEYVFSVSDDENEACELFARSLDPENLETGNSAERALALLACYRNLPVTEGAKARSWSQPFQALWQRIVAEPLQEQQLADQVQTIGNITDEVSADVREQYEANPYPRWVSIQRLPPLSFAERFRRRFPHFVTPFCLEGRLEMLIAGCGTGRDAIRCALNYEGVSVLAIDLSRNSLAYGMRMARSFGVGNVLFMQADILNLTELDRRFSVIQSVGVLHHMAEPLQGWRTLIDLLEPGGIMKVGLYSEVARQDVVEARRRIAALGLEGDAASIRKFRNSVLSDPDSDLASLTRFTDFFSLSECRDLLFHVQEHRFTIPQIAEALDELGLEFVGFELDDARTRDSYLNRFPEDRSLQSLDNWTRLEEEFPSLFTGMYQFWVQKPAK